MSEDGWMEWSKHVLKELERLNNSHENLRIKIEEVQQGIVELKNSGLASQKEIDGLKAWKNNIDEITSPTQLKELQEKVTDLDGFKVKAMTVFVVLQTALGIILSFLVG